MVKFQRVDAGAAVAYWDGIKPFVSKLLKVSNGEYQERDILERVLDGTFQVWLAGTADRIEGFCISEIVEYPRLKRLHITGAAGTNAKTYLPVAMEEIKKFAREMGCVAPIEVRGRRGWAKFLPEYSVSQLVFTVPF